MTVLALTHVPFEDLGSLQEALEERGLTVQTLDVCTTNLAALDPLEPQLLIIMGGPIGVHESEGYPFLTPELELIRHRLQARRPTLGICLGAQLMAAALGASVYAGTNGKEIGWSSISAGPEAASCPALQELLAQQSKVLHWHGDTFDLPPGAAHLAASAQYPHQAFALGNYGLALQFHPEVQASTLERWYVGHACELSVARISVPQLRADSACYAPSLQQAARRLWRRWLADVL